MVELRWLKRVYSVTTFGDHEVENKTTILQYRQSAATVSMGAVAGGPELIPNWTEWQDVPTVEEALQEQE